MSVTKTYLEKFVTTMPCVYTDLSLRDHSEAQKNQGKTWIFSLTPTKKDIRKVVIFVHGTGNDAVFPHLGIFAALLTAGFTVVSFDLPGHGHESTTELDVKSCFELVDKVFCHIDFRFKDYPKYAVGYSIGGALVRSCHGRLSQLKGVCLLATPHLLKFRWRAPLYEVLTFFAPSFYRHRCFYSILGLLPAIGPFGRSRFPIRVSQKDRPYWKVIADVFDVCSQNRFPADSEFKLLMIYGGWDFVAPPSDGELIRREIFPPPPLEILPKHNHYSLLFAPQLPEILLPFFLKNA